MQIRVNSNTVTFDYTTAIRDPNVLTREGLARYSIQAGRAIRQPPIALSYGGFIDEWLNMDDTEAARWSTPEAGMRHRDLAARFQKEFLTWSHVADCPGTPSAREIAVQSDESKQTTVFLIAGSNALEMRLLSVSDTLSPSCREIGIGQDRTSILGEPISPTSIR